MLFSRRFFLKSISVLIGGLGGIKSLTPAFASPPVFTAERNSTAFNAQTLSEVLKNLNIPSSVETKNILIKAPDIAENGAAVPIEISTTINDVRTLFVVVEKNPFPLSASFHFSAEALPFISLKLKMGESSRVRAIVLAQGKYYSAAKEIKVTLGGCGDA